MLYSCTHMAPVGVKGLNIPASVIRREFSIFTLFFPQFGVFTFCCNIYTCAHVDNGLQSYLSSTFSKPRVIAVTVLFFILWSRVEVTA